MNKSTQRLYVCAKVVIYKNMMKGMAIRFSLSSIVDHLNIFHYFPSRLSPRIFDDMFNTVVLAVYLRLNERWSEWDVRKMSFVYWRACDKLAITGINTWAWILWFYDIPSYELHVVMQAHVIHNQILIICTLFFLKLDFSVKDVDIQNF